MGLLLRYLAMSLLQGVVFLDPEELVGVISTDNHDVLICAVEGALQGTHVLRLAHALEGKALLLVPVPQDDLVTALTSL